MRWWSFGDDSGLLEVEHWALELHWRLIDGRSLAWWTDANGRWLRLAPIGLC